jgi:hypothetical protein
MSVLRKDSGNSSIVYPTLLKPVSIRYYGKKGPHGNSRFNVTSIPKIGTMPRSGLIVNMFPHFVPATEAESAVLIRPGR